MANIEWISLHPHFKAQNLKFYGSDHRPILLCSSRCPTLSKRGQSAKFMFENKWLLESSYKDTISSIWSSHYNSCNLHERLSKTGSNLKAWARDNIGIMKRNINKTRKELNKKLNTENPGRDYLAIPWRKSWRSFYHMNFTGTRELLTICWLIGTGIPPISTNRPLSGALRIELKNS